MKKIILLFSIYLFNSLLCTAQFSTKNNFEGQWNNNNTWATGASPGYIIADDNAEKTQFDLFGYTTVGTYELNQSLTFMGTGGATQPDFIIRDTLVVYGNVTFENKAHNLIIGSESLLIVFGDFLSDNKIVVDNGGKFIVTGDMTFEGGNKQSDYTGTDGDLYVFGVTIGNDDAITDTQSEVEFNENEDPFLIDFINSGGNGSLPITLKSFTASINNNNIYLDWVTAKEENFSHFEVERSLDQKNFELIGIVQGLGESLSDVAYALTDNNPSFGKIYYRLKAVDIDDTFEYSPVISIENGFNGQLSVYPNPIESIANIKIRVPEAFKENLSHLALYDLQGGMIQEFSGFDPSKDLEVKQALKSGMYLLKVQHNGIEENIRIMVR